jgi:hypothetical protein
MSISKVSKKSFSKPIGSWSSFNKAMLSAKDRIMIGMFIGCPIEVAIPIYDKTKS